MKMDCPMIKTQGRENAQVQVISPNPNAPKKNRFYALSSMGDQEEYLNIFTGMLQVFFLNVYALQDLLLSYHF